MKWGQLMYGGFALFFALVASVLLGSPARADDAPDDTIADLRSYQFAELYQHCASDWDRLENATRELRPRFKKVIDGFSQKEYDARFAQDDPLILFVSLHWPSDLSERDSGWKSYQFCSGMNLQAKKVLGERGSNHESRIEKIEAVSSCLHVAYDKKKILAPFDKMLACYRERADH